MVGLNDHKRSTTPERRVHDPPRLVRGLAYRLFGWRLTRLVLDAQGRIPFLHPERGSVLSVELDEYRRNLRRIAEVGRRHGFRVLFLDYPLRPLALGEHRRYRRVYRPAGEDSLAAFHATHARYQAEMRAVAREQGVPVLETTERMDAEGARAFDPIDFVHPNDVGARILGELLFEKLLALGWLPEPAAVTGS